MGTPGVDDHRRRPAKASFIAAYKRMQMSKSNRLSEEAYERLDVDIGRY